MDVRIYKHCKSVIQSGFAKTNGWILEYKTTSARDIEPLMGWTSSEDTLNQVRLNFDSKDDAVAFAEKNGWGYDIAAEKVRNIKPKNYSDAFK